MQTFTKSLLPLFFVLLIIALPMFASAQIDGAPGGPDAPIDGGLSLLVAAGVGYGVKRIKARRIKAFS